MYSFYSVPNDSKKLQNVIRDLHVINWFNQRKNISSIPTLRLLNSTTPLAFYPDTPEFWKIAIEVEMFANVNDIVNMRAFHGNIVYKEDELIFIFSNILKCFSQFSRKNLVHRNISLKSMCFCPVAKRYKMIDFS